MTSLLRSSDYHAWLKVMDLTMVGKNLKEWRKAAELSQEEAAVWADMSLIKLQRIERGEGSVTLAELDVLCAIYGRDWRDVELLTPQLQKTPNFHDVPAVRILLHPKVLLDDDLLREIRQTVNHWNDVSLDKRGVLIEGSTGEVVPVDRE